MAEEAIYRDLVIIGAGGFGREVLQYARDTQSSAWPYRVLGFLDDDPAALEGLSVDVEILGPVDSPEILGGACVVSLGEPSLRRRCAEAVREAGGRLVSVIHPSVYVARSASVGHGCVIAPGALVGIDSVIGDNSVINVMASVGHDAVVGEHSVLSSYTALTGAAALGEGVFTGTHVTVNPGVEVGAWSKVSSGAVVVRSADAGSLLVGNPAKGRVIFSIRD